MPRLKFYIDWLGCDNQPEEHPSRYDPDKNLIYINPYYNHNHDFMFWLPLIHELLHYLIVKFFDYDMISTEVYQRDKIHNKLDDIHSWLILHISKRRYKELLKMYNVLSKHRSSIY